MAYTPVMTVIVSGTKLEESTDLTKPVSFFIGKQAYLVIAQGFVKKVLSIGDILVFQSGVDTTKPIGVAFNAMLTDLFIAKYGTPHIPLLNARKAYDKRLKVLNPISYKDYKTQFTSINTPHIVDDVTRKGFLDDLVISSKEDLSNTLVSVNGVFHRTTLHEGKVYVLDGFRTCRVSNRKDVCLVDTTKLGGHSVIPLTTNNVTLTAYNGLATIKAPTSLRNKTVFLVIDGYFYHADTRVFTFLDDKTIRVATNKLPLVDQLRHNPRSMRTPDLFGQDSVQSSRKYDDPYERIFLNRRHSPMSALKTRDFQYSRLTAYHSFLVVVNNPAVFSTTIEVNSTGTHQIYSEMSNRLVSGMMDYGVGLCPSYLILRDPFKRKHIFFQDQDRDVDLLKQTLNPTFTTSIIPNEEEGVNIPIRFVDYVSA